MDTHYEQDQQIVSTGNWIVTLIILAVPLVNIVMLFYWAFSSGTYPSKRTYARANLIVGAVALALYLIFLLFGFFLTSPDMQSTLGDINPLSVIEI